MRSFVIVMMLVIIPVFIFFFFSDKQIYGRRKIIYVSIFLILNFGITGMGIVLQPGWSWYEYITMEYIFSIILITFFQIIGKMAFHVQIMLKRMCLICVGVAAYAILTFGQAYLHSDTAIATLLAQAQIKHVSVFPDTWAYANGEVWFLSLNVFTAPFSILLENQSLARQLGSLAIVVVSMLCIYYHDKIMLKTNSWMISIPILFIFMYGSGDMNLYSAAYIIILMFLLGLISMLYVIFYEKRCKWMIIFFFILDIAVHISGIRYMAEVTVPLWLTCTVMLYLSKKDVKEVNVRMIMRECELYSVLLLTPMMIGYGFIYKNISAVHIVNHTSNNTMVFIKSFQDFWNNLLMIVSDLYINFGFSGGVELFTMAGIRNMISISVCFFLVFIIPVMQAVKIKKEAREVQFFFIFMICHNLIFLLLGSLFGKALTRRYMLSSEYLLILVSSRYIMKYWISAKNRSHRVFWTTVITAVSIFSCISVFQTSSGWVEKVEGKRQFTQDLIDRGLNKYKGYATFWNAYVYEIYSNLKLRFAAVDYPDGVHNGTAKRWLVDTEKYIVENTGSFLLLSEKENEILGEKLEEVYGITEERFVLNKMYVYVWNYDIAENDFKGKKHG
ncbi:MAG: hypothetical protein HFH34_09275 [Eubacterium sp.]|nr:hypothetical protein [Eubacterium sp.]